jgi:hypothetical protein
MQLELPSSCPGLVLVSITSNAKHHRSVNVDRIAAWAFLSQSYGIVLVLVVLSKTKLPHGIGSEPKHSALDALLD